MTPVREMILCVIAGILLSSPCSGGGGLAPLVLQDGRYEPAPQDQIRLDSIQDIQRLSYNSYRVDSVFELFNTGEQITQVVGIKGSGLRGLSAAPPPRFARFNVWIDGRKVQSIPQIEQSDDHGGILPHIAGARCDQDNVDWMVSQITFPGHVKTSVRVTYEVIHGWSDTNRSPLGARAYPAGHSLWYSRYWKGKIGKAVLVIDSSGSCLADFPRYGLRRGVTETVISDYLVKYEREDFEPGPRD